MRAIVVAGLAAMLAGCATRAAAPDRDVVRAAPATARQALVAAIDSMVAEEQFANAHWGILIVDPGSGDTLYSRNAGKLFLPASNMKLVTGAVALEALGADYRFRTTVAARGTLGADSVLDGDVLVIGRGDPTMSTRFHATALEPLLAIGDSLLAHGIRRVRGRVRAAGDAFPGPNRGFGWSWDDLAEYYGAGVDELMLAEGATRLTIRAGERAGDSASIAVDPPGYPLVINRVRTTAPGDSAMLRDMPLVLARDSAAGTVTVSGGIAAGTTRGIDVAYADQRAAFLSLLRDALAARGIVVEGAALDTTRIVDTLFTTVSPPLRDVLPAMMKPSQNQIAEVLFRTIALERTGIGSADSAQRFVDSTLRAWGVRETELVIRDGSGLSRYDYLSPRAIVTVLEHMRRSPLSETYVQSLPVAGVDGTLASRMKGTPAEGVARAKTGFVTAARSLSGYVPTANGRLLLFSLLCNNWTAPQREVEAVQDAIVVRLVGLDLRAMR